MMILVAAMFLLTLVLLALYLYVSGVFTNRRAFRLLVTAFLKGNVRPIPIFPEIFPPPFQILL
jgi:hypothetical protein